MILASSSMNIFTYDLGKENDRTNELSDLGEKGKSEGWLIWGICGNLVLGHSTNFFFFFYSM